jgi:hypothetical protein
MISVEMYMNGVGIIMIATTKKSNFIPKEQGKGFIALPEAEVLIVG